MSLLRLAVDCRVVPALYEIGSDNNIMEGKGRLSCMLALMTPGEVYWPNESPSAVWTILRLIRRPLYYD